jgi:hypothetical protein
MFVTTVVVASTTPPVVGRTKIASFFLEFLLGLLESL